MDVQVTPLPGIGTLEDFTTRSGHRIGVITHRDGHLELIVSRDDDPEACATSTPLSAEESNTLASLLGAPHLVSQLAESRAGAALVARGEFSIVIAGLAVASGRVPSELAALATTYVLLMAVLGPIAARVAEPVVRATVLRRRAAAEPAKS